MDATTARPTNSAELPIPWGEFNFAAVAGTVAIGLGVLAGRLGVHFTGVLSTNVTDPPAALPFTQTLMQNLMAWPAAPIVWSLALQPFGRARLAPLLATTAIARVLVVLLGLYAHWLLGPHGASPDPRAILALTVAAFAVLFAFVLLLVVGARRASPARAWSKSARACRSSLRSRPPRSRSRCGRRYERRSTGARRSPRRGLTMARRTRRIRLNGAPRDRRRSRTNPRQNLAFRAARRHPSTPATGAELMGLARFEATFPMHVPLPSATNRRKLRA